METEQERVRGLGGFIAAVKSNGNYVILATQRLGLEWCGAQILDSQAGATVHWGPGTIEWPNGARARLIVCAHEGDLDRLRGLRLDGAVMLYGDPDRPFAPGTVQFLERIAHGAEFKLWAASW